MKNWWRITQYDPAKRNERGAYKGNAWTAISDIGKEFDDGVLTFDEYSRVEDLYADAFVRLARASGNDLLEVRGHEHSEGLIEGQLLSITEAEEVLRLMLREKLWCRLEAVDNSFATHVGYDYYMYIGSDEPSSDEIEIINDSGLFVDEDFVSPHIPEKDLDASGRHVDSE